MSDATPAIGARLAEQDPWPEAVLIDTGTEVTLTGPWYVPVTLALEAVRPHGAEHVWRPVRPYMAPD